MRDSLLPLKKMLDEAERSRLSPLATPSALGVRRHVEDREGYRQTFSQDTDRILHAKAYTRYIDKTQVFYLIKNDHITHRVLHVQLVSKIARTIGRFLRLNEDLIEAIALGHDIGHPPFGHDGELFLAELCVEHGLDGFLHNIQSVMFLDQIERGGKGWNLTLQTLDGILCHDGEVHDSSLKPNRNKNFNDHAREMEEKTRNPAMCLSPMTLEGCLVRFADTISYIGRDIEDAIELGLIDRRELPGICSEVLGTTNGTIVYRLVSDLIANSIDKDEIAFSSMISDSLRELKRFNYERIYLNEGIKKDLPQIRNCYRVLFESYLADLAEGKESHAIYRNFLLGMDPAYLAGWPPAAVVRDFIAGMTDDYFLEQATLHGCEVPEKT